MESLSLSTARILVVSPSPGDSAYIEYFFDLTPFTKPDFSIAKFQPSYKYNFIVFDARSLPAAPNIETFAKLPEAVQGHYFLLDRYLQDTNKYILYFGKYYYNLNQERCPSANSKFTLYARVQELIDFINNYKSE